MDLHPDRLGAWKAELVNGTGIVRRPKQYYFDSPTGVKKAYSGINFDRYEGTIGINDYIYGKTITGQLLKYNDIGYGIILVPGSKIIKAIWDLKDNEILTQQTRFLKEHFV